MKVEDGSLVFRFRGMMYEFPIGISAVFLIMSVIGVVMVVQEPLIEDSGPEIRMMGAIFLIVCLSYLKRMRKFAKERDVSDEEILIRKLEEL